jgi:outer membrane receptor protein involved in Fe transport
MDDGENKRGFAAAAGNILINDRYPSAKQDKPSSLLERLPANQVRRIDLIRGRIRDIDLRGQAIVASVILYDDRPASTRWDAAVRKNFNHSPVTLRTSISRAESLRALEYNIGLTYRRFRSQEIGPEDIFDSAGTLLEARDEESFLRGQEGSASLNLLTWVGDTVVSMNSRISFDNRNETLDAVRAPQAPGLQDDNFFVDDTEKRQFEFGLDAERSINANFLGRAVLLYSRKNDDFLLDQNRVDSSGNRVFYRLADGDVVESEMIARLELNWAGWKNHGVRLNLEGARNVIDSALVQTVDSGMGPEIVPVPGANTRVVEDRADILIDDTLFSERFEMNYGIGMEASTIKQTGDATNQRNFVFLKPQFSFTYTPVPERLTRIRLAREVSQLNFSDFVSSTVFQDDDVALGNPDLKPESTWIAELTGERQFGELSVLRLTLFHHWISDVEDLLPLSPEFEVPGNIGDGRRWGAILESTVPLDWLGLAEARLDIEGRLQHSSVTDPVTGAARVLSGSGDVSKPLPLEGENQYAVGVNFRQDFEAARFAWGWELRKRADRFAFRVNELVEYADGLEVNAFVETTRWFDLKIRIEALNLADFNQYRYRSIYVGERGLSPLDILEVRNRTDGRRVILTISGSF